MDKQYNTTKKQIVKLRNEWSRFLDRFNFDWFATLTFKDLQKTYTAINRFNWWIRAIEQGELRQVGYYRVMEFTRQGVPHFHALMGNLQGVKRSKWWKLWFAKNGRARISPYNQRLGANHYLTKYVIKDEYSDTDLWEVKNLQILVQGVLTFD